MGALVGSAPPEVDVSRSLVGELLHHHRVVLRLLAVLLVVALATAGYLVSVTFPRLERAIDMTYHARSTQIASLEQTVDLRGWLVTGDRDYLDTFEQHGREAERSRAALVEMLVHVTDVRISDQVLATAVAHAAWSAWADGVVAAELNGRPDVREELAAGRVLFDEYRRVNDRATELLLAEREAALSASRTALGSALLLFAAGLLATAVATVRRRRAVVVEVVEPTRQLLGTIAALRDGDLSARSPRSGVAEVDEVGGALAELAASLREAQDSAVAREARLSSLAHRFETIVRVGREIAGSLSVRYVSATVTEAASALLGTPTVLWVRGSDTEFQAAARSSDPHGAVPPQELVPAPAVNAAAADARTCAHGDVRAYPLVLAGMVVGVLETQADEVDADTEQVLEALLSTAAAALESATLHSAARELADVDALTRLPNRRRFEGDIEAEWDRCRRYGRPMSLVMLDLDHFKTLNDGYGHLFGDEVLRGAAEALSSALRTSDTAYRYGGEEFAVLLRETGLEDGQDAAERLRRAIREASVPRHGVQVTASAGVAERVSTMAHHTELVAKADAALYVAKREGRDRVAVPADAGRDPARDLRP